jgi:hypothetical protein
MAKEKNTVTSDVKQDVNKSENAAVKAAYEWRLEVIHNSPLSRNTELFNWFNSEALPKLINKLKGV